jgi:hypothetical protein
LVVVVVEEVDSNPIQIA